MYCGFEAHTRNNGTARELRGVLVGRKNHKGSAAPFEPRLNPVPQSARAPSPATRCQSFREKGERPKRRNDMLVEVTISRERCLTTAVLGPWRTGCVGAAG